MRSTLLIALTACTGSIFMPPPPEPGPEPQVPALPVEPTCSDTLQPGRTPLHRLTRLEYDRSVAALLGDTTGPARTFPADPRESGFDTVSDVQTVSELHAEAYEAAAWQLADDLWYREADRGVSKRFDLAAISPDAGVDEITQTCCYIYPYNHITSGPWKAFLVAYGVSVLTELDRPVDYTVKFHAYVDLHGGSTQLWDGGTAVLAWNLHFDAAKVLDQPAVGTLAAPHDYQQVVHPERPGVYQLLLRIEDSERLLELPNAAWVDFITLERAPTAVPPNQRKVIHCELAASAACVRTTLEGLMRRAWRRPVASPEVDAVYDLYSAARAAGDDVRTAFSSAVVGVLLSSHFLFRVERDPDLRSTAAHALSPHELAARLSYFLTSGPPDDQLAARADDGSLASPQVLDAELERLWLDNATLAQHFGTQLMSTNALDVISPSPSVFPAFDAALRNAMGMETDRFFGAVFTEDRPAAELVDARFTFVNDRLAAHYGLPPPHSATPTRITLDTDQRGGALGLGTMLSLNATPTRPSQVLRGKWVLTQLMCDEPPPPPANIPPLGQAPGSTPREQLEAHARNPFCASCHQRMDPIGFALDKYDADGSFHERDRQNRPIDSTGHFPGGETFDGLVGLRAVLAADPKLDACMTQHLMAYGLSRAPQPDDRCLAKSLAEHAGPRPSFKQLIKTLVHSPAFTARQAEGSP